MSNFRRIAVALLVLIFSITVVGCGSKSVAIVNGEKITKTDLDKRMKKVKMSMESQGVAFSGQQGQMMIAALEKQTLDDMITQALITQAAKKEGVYPAKTEVKKAIDEIIASFGGEKKFKEALKTYNYTTKEIEELKTFDIARTKLFDKITANVTFDDQDVKTWYAENKENYKEPAKIKAKAILIKYDNPELNAAMGQAAPKVNRNEEQAKKIAEDIIKGLDDGTDFAKLAKEKSEDDATKADGGQIKGADGSDTYAKGTLMPKEFDDAIVELKVGSYTKTPVKTAQGYYVIKLEALTPEKQLTFEEAKQTIEQEIPATRKQMKFSEYLTKLRESAKVENKLEKEQPAQQTAPAPGGNGQELPAGHPSVNGDSGQSQTQPK